VETGDFFRYAIGQSKKNDAMTRTALFLFCLLLALPLHQANAAWGRPSCEVAKAERPLWVSKGDEFRKPGFRLGRGEARYNRKLSYRDLLAEAQAAAQQDLVNSIQVTVRAESKFELRESGDGKHSTVSRDVSQQVSSQSQLDLPGLEMDSWQDPDTCSVFALALIAERDLAVVQQKAKVDHLMSVAQDLSAALSDRLDAARSALAVLELADFSRLHDSLGVVEYRRRFAELEATLAVRLASRRNAVYLVGDSEVIDALKETLLQEISQQVGGSFLAKGSCTRVDDCLYQSLQDGTPFTTIVVIRMSPTQDKGFWVSPFELQLSLWNTREKRPRYQQEKQVQVMSRQRHQLTPESAFRKWQNTYPTLFADLRI
jgi:hypothetical protein